MVLELKLRFRFDPAQRRRVFTDEPQELFKLRLLTQENEHDRLRLLQLLYVKGRGKKRLIALNFHDATEQDEIDTRETVSHLEQEGFVIIETDPERLPAELCLRLTHKGVIEVEKTVSDPKEATKDFTLPNIVVLGDRNSVQTGGSSIVNYNFGAHTDEILRLLGKPRKSFQGHKRLKAPKTATAPEEEIQRQNPRPSRVKAFLSQLEGVAVKTGVRVLVEITKGIIGY